MEEKLNNILLVYLKSFTKYNNAMLDFKKDSEEKMLSQELTPQEKEKEFIKINSIHKLLLEELHILFANAKNTISILNELEIEKSDEVKEQLSALDLTSKELLLAPHVSKMVIDKGKPKEAVHGAIKEVSEQLKSMYESLSQKQNGPTN